MNIAVQAAGALTATLSLTEAAEAVAKGETTAVELTVGGARRHRGRRRARQLLHLARRRAGAGDGRRGLDKVPLARRGKLHGVPLAHKDMYYEAGKLSTCGSKIRRRCSGRAIPPTVIERLEAQGSFSLGRAQHGRVRARTPPATTSITAIATIPGARLLPRRLLVRLGRGGGGALRLCGARLRYRRLDPPAGLALRRHRHQGHADPRLARMA